jgi:hypothetical protein
MNRLFFFGAGALSADLKEWLKGKNAVCCISGGKKEHGFPRRFLHLFSQQDRSIESCGDTQQQKMG